MGTSVVFTLGLSSSEADYAKLATDVAAWWQPRLPAGTKLYMNRWDKDVLTDLIKQVPPTDKLVLMGFSFGGGKTVEVATSLNAAGRVVAGIVLIDPVDYKNPNTPNTHGFPLPPNVKKAWSFYRGATASPWSSFIATAACEFYNKRYVPSSNDVQAAHGQYVWSGETVNAVKAAMA